MTLNEQHQARHVGLDAAILELWADFALHFPRALPQDTTVGQLMTWSRRQLVEPTDPPTENFMCAHCREPVEGPHRCEESAAALLEVNGNVE